MQEVLVVDPKASVDVTVSFPLNPGNYFDTESYSGMGQVQQIGFRFNNWSGKPKLWSDGCKVFRYKKDGTVGKAVGTIRYDADVPAHLFEAGQRALVTALRSSLNDLSAQKGA